MILRKINLSYSNLCLRPNFRGVARMEINMKGKRKAGVIFVWILCLVMLLSGCGSVKVPESLQASAVSVDKKGEVTAYIMETFDKSYYDLDELTEMVTKEIEDFNTSHKNRGDGEAASVVSVSLTGDVLKKAVVVLWFKNAASYRDYMGLSLFYGTVAEALTAGYDLSTEMVSVKAGSTLNNLNEKGENRILIVEDNVRVYGPAKPLYMNQGAVMNADGSVEPSDTEENTFIIMK